MAKVVGCLCFQVMEQVDGGDLVLNKGEEEKPRERSEDEPERDLQAVEGMTEGYKLALVSHIFFIPTGFFSNMWSYFLLKSTYYLPYTTPTYMHTCIPIGQS